MTDSCVSTHLNSSSHLILIEVYRLCRIQAGATSTDEVFLDYEMLCILGYKINEPIFDKLIHLVSLQMPLDSRFKNHFQNVT